MSDTTDKLEADGWTQRFTASGPRLQEAIETYQGLGFEVKTVPVKEMGGNDCSVCFENANDKSVMIFTREDQTLD